MENIDNFANNDEHLDKKSNMDTDEIEDFLNDCSQVYLDVGSNRGIQIRKLFQPQLYPTAKKIQKVFHKYFGEKRDNVCAIGFEPNTRLTDELKLLEKSYNKCGWKVKIYTRTAIGNHSGEGVLKVPEDSRANFFWSALDNVNNIKSYKAKVSYKVTVLRLASFILNHVVPRSMNDQEKPTIVMKMDIEGGEFTVLPDLIFSGALRHINYTYIEFHNRKMHYGEHEKKLANILRDFIKNNANQYKNDMKISGLDDETYAGTRYELPQC